MHKCEHYPQWTTAGDSWEAIRRPFISEYSAWSQRVHHHTETTASAKHETINMEEETKKKSRKDDLNTA